MIHLAGRSPDAQSQMRVAEDARRLPRARARGGELREVECPRSQGALPLGPAGRRMRVVELRGRAVEAFLAHLALESALGKIGVRLPRGASFDARKRDPRLHGPDSCVIHTSCSRAPATRDGAYPLNPIVGCERVVCGRAAPFTALHGFSRASEWQADCS